MTEVAWLAGDQLGANGHMRPKGPRRNGNHLVSRLPGGNTRADPGNDAGAFTAKDRPAGGQAGVEVECFHHVAEVQTGSVDGNFHFPRADHSRVEEAVAEVLDAG